LEIWRVASILELSVSLKKHICELKINKMKKSILITLVTLLSFISSYAQITKKDFIGHWTTDGSSTECVIWIDKNDNFQFVEWDRDGGSGLEVLNIKYENNNLLVRTRFKENNWVVTTTFSLIDEYNMNAKIIGDANTTIKYKKLK
jgi:hypothetical protein